MTRLCIVRHGETAWNAEHRVQGQLDVPLNAIGLSQAQALAKALANEEFDVVYSSDLQRARQTAEPYSQSKNKKIIFDPDLRERHYGIFQTHTYADVQVKFPDDYAAFLRHEPDFAFRTGESLRAFAARSMAVLSKIESENQGKDILVVTHGGVLDILYRHITGLDLSAPRDFGIPNCGINRVGVAPGGWQIQCWAEVAHLESALDDLRE